MGGCSLLSQAHANTALLLFLHLPPLPFLCYLLLLFGQERLVHLQHINMASLLTIWFSHPAVLRDLLFEVSRRLSHDHLRRDFTISSHISDSKEQDKTCLNPGSFTFEYLWMCNTLLASWNCAASCGILWLEPVPPSWSSSQWTFWGADFVPCGNFTRLITSFPTYPTWRNGIAVLFNQSVQDGSQLNAARIGTRYESQIACPPWPNLTSPPWPETSSWSSWSSWVDEKRR